VVYKKNKIKLVVRVAKLKSAVMIVYKGLLY